MKEIIESLERLGGVIGDHSEIQDTISLIRSVRFDVPLYYYNWDFVGVEEVCEQHKELYYINPSKFLDKLITHFRIHHDKPFGKHEWKGTLFTPLKEGTADCDEWKDWFTPKDSMIEMFQDLSSCKTPSFFQIIYSYDYPDHYYICLEDPNPDDPLVFGTDHETFFNDVSSEGAFSSFISDYYDEHEMRTVLKEFLDEETPQPLRRDAPIDDSCALEELNEVVNYLINRIDSSVISDHFYHVDIPRVQSNMAMLVSILRDSNITIDKQVYDNWEVAISSLLKQNRSGLDRWKKLTEDTLEALHKHTS